MLLNGSLIPWQMGLHFNPWQNDLCGGHIDCMMVNYVLDSNNSYLELCCTPLHRLCFEDGSSGKSFKNPSGYSDTALAAYAFPLHVTNILPHFF